MIKLFKRNEPPSEPKPDPTIAIQDQITELQRKHHILHSEIMSEPNLIKKKQLQVEEARLLQKISTLKQQKQPYDEAKATKEIDALFKDPKRTIILEINGRKTKLPEDLTINLKFHPCQHKKKLHIRNILTHQHSVGGTPTEQTLLSKWQAIFSANTTLNTAFYCEECRRVKQKKFRETQIRSDKEIIGTCTLQVKIV